MPSIREQHRNLDFPSFFGWAGPHPSGPFFLIMKVRAIKKHPYRGIERNIGDEYEMDDVDLQVMEAYGNIMQPMNPTTAREYQRAAVKKYKTRVLKAEK